MRFCGTSLVHDEEGLCHRHLAERWGVPVHRIHHLVKSGKLEAGPADLGCGVRRRGDQLIPLGMILEKEDER